jgi:protein-disulfide isomerase
MSTERLLAELHVGRRHLLTGAGALALAGAAGLPTVARAQSDSVPVAELMTPGPLGDRAMGADNAPVTIIEYASMTCPHCAQFTIETFPKLKERYIDTGKVRFIFREFPLDIVAAGASMLARCADKDKFFTIIDLLFETQSKWAVEKPLGPLFNVVRQTGYTEEAFKACLANQQILDGIQKERDRAATKLGVASTPTLFINGKRKPGALSIDEIEKEIKPYL